MKIVQAKGFPGGDPPERVIVLGAGGHAVVLSACLRLASSGSVELADPARIGQRVGGFPVRGGDDWVMGHGTAEVLLVNAVGSTRVPEARRHIFEKFKSAGFYFATLVHPSAVVDAAAILEEGAQVMAGCVVQAGAVIGTNALINTGATVDHDTTVSAHSHVGPGVTLCGAVNVGTASHIGAGSTVVQSVSVGAGCLVAAGSVVVADVADGLVVRGAPARPVQDGKEEA